ncbi:MAG: organic solvent tolerance protein OstA [Chryseobacterium sp.]|nr:MAG: organic solvent tolerance protein OstA [Chryseobacterium sp.]
MRRLLLLLLLLPFVAGFAQTGRTDNAQQPVRDPFFTTGNRRASAPPEKIKYVHSDKFQRSPDLYGGNPFFSGNVRFEHQGAVLKADTVVLYEKENFVKARRNVELTTADGSRLTARELEYDANTKKAIARGNVVLSDPQQTLKTETLYYDRNNNTAYFNTGGTINDGRNIVYSKTGTYFVDERKSVLEGNYTINNDQYLVEGRNVNYFRDQAFSVFNGPTTVTNKRNPSNYVYTEKGRYLMNSKEVYLEKNSRIHYRGKILTGDDMYYNQITGFGKATGNVQLDDPAERRYIRGGYGEIYEQKDSAMVTEKPYAVKILSKDSLYLSAKKILAFQKTDSSGNKKSFLRAYPQARVYKTNLQARADSLAFNETDGQLHFVGRPIAWTGEKQVSGDVIQAYMNMQREQLDSIKVSGNAFAISKADSLNNKDEFNQVKGRLMNVYLREGEIYLANVVGNAQAITYADNQDPKTKEMDRIGIALSTCGEIEASFLERKVRIITCNIGANTDLYPMSMIARERRFFPDFNWNTKDRLRRWQDIFLDSPDYPETVYISDDSLYERTRKAAEEAAQKNKPPARTRK